MEVVISLSWACCLGGDSNLLATQITGKKRGRVENLRPWKPGQSGNPGGRPKNNLAREISQAIFENNPEKVYAAMAKALFKGNPKAFTALSECAYGKAEQPVHHEGGISFQVSFVNAGDQATTKTS